MLLEPTPGEQELLAESLGRDGTRLSRRERIAEIAVALAYAIACLALAAARPPHSLDLGALALCVGVLAIATRVQFHVASGFTVPTQLAFVPLLLAAPVAAVPPAVAAALVLARLPEVVRGRTPGERLLPAIGNAWFAFGPAVTLAVFGTNGRAASVAVLLLALGAQFAVDFAVSCARDAIESGTSVQEQLREAWVYAVDAALAPVGFALALVVRDRPVAILALLPLLAVFGFFARERRARLESVVELMDAYRGTALVLGDVIEADDDYTGEHCKSVVRLALDVGARLGLSAARMRNLEFGALLHDVGKVAIPKEIINKPGALDPHEWTIVKTHTVEGQRLLDRVGGMMRAVGLIVRSHHERWDGSGYPDALAGDAIPLEARIISCCDAWNAMRTTRSYRHALPHEEAVREMLAGAGGQFDPELVQVLLEVVGQDRRASGLELWAPQLATPEAEPAAPDGPRSES